MTLGSRLVLAALALALAVPLAPRSAAAQSYVAFQNDQYNLYSLARMYHYGFGVKDKAKAHALYRQSAARGNHKASEALITFDRFSWPDQKSQDIYTARVTANLSTINGCQARANAQGSAVTCLVPGVDWNPKTWETC